MEGLTDRSRRPYRHANRLPFQLEKLIVQLKQERPSWGAPKIREKLRRLHTEISLPAISTVHAVLDRHGLVSKARRARYKATGTALEQPTAPNDLWCADYKGEFMLTDRRYCYPLTITNASSRYLLCCEALEATQEDYAFTVFERTFRDFGLPRVIRATRAYASNTEEGGYTARGSQFPAAAGQVRSYQGLAELQYPFHDRTITVTSCGRICIGRRKINSASYLPVRKSASKRSLRRLLTFIETIQKIHL
jgi:transposase InsO family protein